MKNIFTVFVALTCILSKTVIGQLYNCRYTLFSRIADDEHLIKYISFNDKVVEFELSSKKITKIDLQQDIETEFYLYDTIGVKVIDFYNDTYIQISSFSDEFTVIKNGIYDSAPFNLKSTYKSLMNFDIKMKDTIIMGHKYYYDVSIEKDENGNDSILTKFYFQRGPKILSLFKRNGLDKIFMEYKDDLVGIEIKFIDANLDILFLIIDIAPLEKEEELICEKILSRIKLNAYP